MKLRAKVRDPLTEVTSTVNERPRTRAKTSAPSIDEQNGQKLRSPVSLYVYHRKVRSNLLEFDLNDGVVAFWDGLRNAAESTLPAGSALPEGAPEILPRFKLEEEMDLSGSEPTRALSWRKMNCRSP